LKPWIYNILIFCEYITIRVGETRVSRGLEVRWDVVVSQKLLSFRKTLIRILLFGVSGKNSIEQDGLILKMFFLNKIVIKQKYQQFKNYLVKDIIF